MKLHGFLPTTKKALISAGLEHSSVFSNSF